MSCSIEEPTMTVAEKRAKARAVHVGFCCKCKTTKSTITVRYAEYCDPCFLIALDSKFRNALRSARPYRVVTPDNVMLAFSGGSSSRSLIHLFDVFHTLPPEVVSNKQQPKIYNNIHVCHIDESSLSDPAIISANQSLESQSTLQQAEAIAKKYNYKFFGVRIEDIYDSEWTDSRSFEATATLMTSLPKDQLITSGQSPELLSKILPQPDQPKLSQEEKIGKLKALLGVCTALTAKETVLQHFRSILLVQLTKRASCNVLALGDSATRVAIQIIGLTAIGRGYSLPHETSTVSNWVQDCKVIRPLKDCLVNELDTYCRLNNLELIENNAAKLDWSIKTKGEAKSIKRLTEDFITGLDREFPSTAATVCRTAAKLTAPDVAYKDKCPLCHGPVQEGVYQWKERITVMTAPPQNLDYSSGSIVSTNTEDECCSSNGDACCGGNRTSNKDASCMQSSKSQTLEDNVPFSSLLCYGCLTNLRDLDLKSIGSKDNKDFSSFELPPYVAENVLDRLGYSSLEDYKESRSLQKHADSSDPRENLREQIKEFLLDSDDEDE